METENKRRKSQTTKRLIWKTVIVCIVVVGTNVVGNYALARGLRHVGVIDSWSPLPYIKAFFQLWVGVGVAFMLTWLIARLALLSWADLSYVLLVTSFSYVLTAVAGVVGLNETVNWIHWMGICLITVGVALVVRTSPRTSENPEAGK